MLRCNMVVYSWGEAVVSHVSTTLPQYAAVFKTEHKFWLYLSPQWAHGISDDSFNESATASPVKKTDS